MFGPVKNKLFSCIIKKAFKFSTRHITFFRKDDRCKKEDPYYIERATKKDECTILDLMYKSFFPEEPCFVALGLGHKHNPTFDDQILKALSEGLSIVARCKYTDCMVGASVNCANCSWDPDLKDQLACSCCCPQTRQLLHFYAYLQRAPCLWERYCTEKVFELAYLTVKRDDRGKGLGARLLAASRDLGADCSYRVIRTDATSYYTAKICEKLNFKMAFELPYCAYTGPDHQPLIKAAPPHFAAKVYIVTPHAMK